MSRFISFLLFLVVFCVICLYPSVHTTADVAVTLAGDAFGSGSTPAQSTQAPNNSESAGKYVMATPSPTPTPTPKPTPTPTPKPTPTPPPIVKGTSGDDVTAIQRRLRELGFMTEAVDGSYGGATERAVKRAIEYLNMVNGNNSAGNAQDAVEAPAPGEGTQKATPQPKQVTEDGSFVDYELQKALLSKDFPIYNDSLKRGDSGLDAYRLQRRLNALTYIYKGVDGIVGTNTLNALAEFQRNNGLKKTGVVDRVTLELLYSGNAAESSKVLHPYKLIVDVSDQRVSVYKWNEQTERYSDKVQEFVCSTGRKDSPTPLGTYQESTGPAARWHYFTKFNCWAQYAFSIEGDVLFHSVLYGRKDEKTLVKSSVSNLGKAASHGCVRLAVKDAKWIWDNCPNGTTVVIQQ